MARLRSRLVPASVLSMTAFVALAGLPIGQVALAAGSPAAPSVRLIAARDQLSVTRFRGQPVYLDPGVLVASVGGAFEIRAKRPDYAQPAAFQLVHGAAGTWRRDIPDALVPTMHGMARFLRIRVVDKDGRAIVKRLMRFCPEGTDSRVSPNSPGSSSYPRMCFSTSPFVRGSVWGIERGWAVSAFGWGGLMLDIPNGRYRMDISIGGDWADVLAVTPAHASVSIELNVHPTRVACPEGCFQPGIAPEHGAPASHGQRGATARARGPLGVAPTAADPDTGTLPDLVALPAWGIRTTHRSRGDFLEFSATVWNAGPAPLVVEGYRDGDEQVMAAWQYFFRDGVVVGRARVGTMEYDGRYGHKHWHFKQFARYSLLDSDSARVVLSQKEAFCLAPTDAIDMTVRGAEWTPGSTGLGTACGDASSIWTREVLQAGWGDTYVQSLPGQSFDITDVPNGRYLIEVVANPKGVLYQRTRANDRELREITLGGSRGDRTVTVAPWHGIRI